MEFNDMAIANTYLGVGGWKSIEEELKKKKIVLT